MSPCVIDNKWDGSAFAELQASFTNPSLRYHAIGMFMFKFAKDIRTAARQSAGTESATLMWIVTVKKMTVFDLMTGGDDSGKYVNQMTFVGDDFDEGGDKKTSRDEKVNAVRAKLEECNGSNLKYENIAMPEIDVVVYFNSEHSNGVNAKMKMKRVIRYCC